MAQSLYGRGDWGRGLYSAVRYADVRGAPLASFDVAATYLQGVTHAVSGAPAAEFAAAAQASRRLVAAGEAGMGAAAMAFGSVAFELDPVTSADGWLPAAATLPATWLDVSQPPPTWQPASGAAPGWAPAPPTPPAWQVVRGPHAGGERGRAA